VEEQEALQKLEPESNSSPVVDVSDLLEGWGDTSSGGGQSLGDEFKTLRPEMGQNISQPNGARIKTKNERGLSLEQPEFETAPMEWKHEAPPLEPRVITPPPGSKEPQEITHIAPSVQNDRGDSDGAAAMRRRRVVTPATVFDEEPSPELKTLREVSAQIQPQTPKRTRISYNQALVLFSVGMFVIGVLVAILVSS
jgi:hypothetical protein